jgi:hypothetical protein
MHLWKHVKLLVQVFQGQWKVVDEREEVRDKVFEGLAERSGNFAEVQGEITCSHSRLSMLTF